MSPLPPSTLKSIELGLSNRHDLRVKEFQPHRNDAASSSCELDLSNQGDLKVWPRRDDTQSLKDVQSRSDDIESVKDVQPCRDDEEPVKDVQPRRDDTESVKEVQPHEDNAESVKQTQPEVKKFLTHQEKAQAELDEWRKFRKVHCHIPQSSGSSGDHAESEKKTQHEVQKTLNHQEKAQAELDEWRNFRNSHNRTSKVQPSKEDTEPLKDVRPHGQNVNSFSQQKQMELDEWREFRKAHAKVPQHPIKALGELFDMGYPEGEDVVPTKVEGISAWKRKNKGKGGRFKSVMNA